MAGKMQTSRLLDAVNLIPNFEPVAGLSCIVENIGQQVSDFQCLVCEIQCDITSIVNHLVSFQHRMAFLKHCKPAMYDDVIKLASRNQQHDLVKRKCFEIQGQEGRGRPQMRHRQNMANPKTVRNDDTQAPLTASSIACPLFDSTYRGLVSTQRTQALYSLRLSLLEELNKRGIPPQVSKEIVEARLRLLEQYEKQGVPFHLAKERVIHEEERWNLLVDFERQSLSFEEAEQRIDRRFCLLKLYESQGMQRADAAMKIIQEEVVRDFKAEFVKLGCMHTEAQELAEKRLLLLDTYQRQGFSPEEASRKIITEELAWRDSTNSVLRQRQSTVDYNHLRGSLNDRPSFWQEHSSVSPAVTSRRDGAAATCVQQVDVVKKGTEQAQTFASQKYFLNSAGDSAHSSNFKNETKVSKTRQIFEEDHSVEEAFSSRISKLLEKLVSHSAVSTRAGEEETQDKEAEKALEKFQAWDSNLSEADKERLLEEFEKKCREEIQKLLAQLLECQVPPEEAGTRLQTLKAEHENRRQSLFLTSCSSKSEKKDKQHSYQHLLIEKIARRKELNKDDWTEVKGTLSPERRATIKKERDPGVSGTKLSSERPSNFQKQEKRQRSEKDREFFVSSGSGSTSTKNQRCQSSSSRSTPGSLKRRTRKRMQRDNHRQSSDSEESRKSFRKLYTKTKPLGALDFFEQVLKGSSTSDNKTLLLSAGPSLEKRPGHQSPSHLRSFSPSSHSTSFSSYSRNRSRSPLSRIRSPSVKSGFSRRRSRHRSRSRQRSSTYMHHSRTRSPAFRFRHSRKGHVRSPSWHSRLSDPSSHQSRSKSSRSMQTKHREDVSHEKPGHSFRKTSNVPCSPERHFSQHLRSCSRTRSQSSGSGQSFMKRYRERSYSRKRTPLPRLHGLSPPSLADHSPQRKDDGSPRRWSSNMRDQSNSPSRQIRDCVRETSKRGQYSVRYDHHGPRQSFGRHGREGRLSWDSERPAHNVKRLESSDNSPRFHFQSGVWYDSDVDKHSLSSFNSSAGKVLTSPKQQESKADRPTQSTDHPAKLGGPLRERKRLLSMESISSSDNDETADHPANLDGPSRERKRLPSMESISSCDNDESTNHLAKIAGPSREHKRLPSVETISSSDNESTDHPANLGGPLRERKRLPSMESISSCDNDELYGVEDCDSAKDGVEASGSVQGGIRPSGSVKEGAEPSCSVQNSVKLSGSTKDNVEPSGSDQCDVEPSGSAKDGVELS